MKRIFAAQFMCVVFTGSMIFAQTNSAGKQFQVQKVPNSYRCIPSAVVGQWWPADDLRWPDATRIQTKSVNASNEAVVAAIASTMSWLSRILQPQWTPNQSDLDVLTLREEISLLRFARGTPDAVVGHDAIRFRYNIEESIIEVASTHAHITLTIQPASERGVTNRIENAAEAGVQVGSVVARFFRESEKIKAESVKNISAFPFGFKGKSSGEGEGSLYWWGSISWWTDGRTTVFTIAKKDGGSWYPAPKDHWFTPEEPPSTNAK